MASRATAEDPPVAPDDEPGGTTHSGRLLLRMPQSLHGELARAAEREGVSLNAYITAALASSVHWRAGGSSAPSSRVRKLLVADLVLVAVATVAAVALMLVAAL